MDLRANQKHPTCFSFVLNRYSLSPIQSSESTKKKGAHKLFLLNRLETRISRDDQLGS